MNIKNLRLEKGWSQEQLAEISGISGRTIQRIEKGEKPSLDSQNSLAAAFDMTLTELQTKLSEYSEKAVTEIVANEPVINTWKGFFINLATFMVVITWLLVISRNFEIDLAVPMWVGYMWAMGLLGHALTLLNKDNKEE